jgi:hypothetical protein
MCFFMINIFPLKKSIKKKFPDNMGFWQCCPEIKFPSNINPKYKENKPIEASLTPKQFDWIIKYQQ